MCVLCLGTGLKPSPKLAKLQTRIKSVITFLKIEKKTEQEISDYLVEKEIADNLETLVRAGNALVICDCQKKQIKEDNQTNLFEFQHDDRQTSLIDLIGKNK